MYYISNYVCTPVIICTIYLHMISVGQSCPCPPFGVQDGSVGGWGSSYLNCSGVCRVCCLDFFFIDPPWVYLLLHFPTKEKLHRAYRPSPKKSSTSKQEHLRILRSSYLFRNDLNIMIEFRMIDKMSGWLLISPLIAMIICHFQRSPWMEEGKWTSAIICPSGIALDPDSSPYVRLWGLRQSPAPVEVIWCFVACSDHPGINWNVSFESFDPRRCLFYPILQVLFLGANMWKKQKVQAPTSMPIQYNYWGYSRRGHIFYHPLSLAVLQPQKKVQTASVHSKATISHNLGRG